MSRVLFLLLAMVLAGLGQPTSPRPCRTSCRQPYLAAPPVAPLLHGQRATAATGGRRAGPAGQRRGQRRREATTKDGLKIGNGSLRLRQDDPGPTWESPLRDPRLNPYAPRQPLTDGPRPVAGRVQGLCCGRRRSTASADRSSRRGLFPAAVERRPRRATTERTDRRSAPGAHRHEIPLPDLFRRSEAGRRAGRGACRHR